MEMENTERTRSAEWEKRALESEGFQRFRQALAGWMTSPDGEDYCPDCWQKYLEGLRERDRNKGPYTGAFASGALQKSWEEFSHEKMARKDSRSTAEADNARTRRCAEGWLVLCENYQQCRKEVFVPYNETPVQ